MTRSLERLVRLSNALPAGFTAHPCDVERDVAELTTLTNENYHAVGYPLLYSEGDMREGLTAFGINAANSAIVVRASTGVIAGWAWAIADTDSEKPRAYLDGGVHPLFHGIGLGRALLEWSRDRAEELLAPFPGATIQAHCVELHQHDVADQRLGQVGHLAQRESHVVEHRQVGEQRAELERAFEPFYTSDGTRGAGLGLAIAHELVERMGGTLSVESAPGRTTFAIELRA